MGHRVRLGGGAGPVVEHGVLEKLGGDGQLAAIACQQRESRRQAAAAALAGDGDPPPEDDELVRRSVRPPQGRVAVLQPGGVGVLGRQPVIHRDHDAPGPPGEEAALRFIHVRGTHDHAASV